MKNESPLVSILIPGFKPQWLDLCISSCINQTFQNVEILVGDDTEDGIISDIASKWSSLNISVHRNHKKSMGTSNRWNLFEKSKGTYIKYVFDDDFLFPLSVEALVTACERHSASMAFHQRICIGNHGQRLPDLPSIQAPTDAVAGQSFIVPREIVLKNMINQGRNLIGEPSNCMFRRDVLQTELDKDGSFFSRSMIFLGDVRSYLNAALTDQPIVLVNGAFSAFRSHGQQASQSAIRPAGYYEWDFLRRYIFRLGLLSDAEFSIGLKNQVALYENMNVEFELKGELIEIAKAANEGNNYLDRDFQRVITKADKILS
jgi:glycosyltransferase involved in cell wall biosynthesis